MTIVYMNFFLKTYRPHATAIYFACLCFLLAFFAHSVSAAEKTENASASVLHAALKNPAALFKDRFFYDPSPEVSFSAASPDGQVTLHTTLRPELQQRLMSYFIRSAPLIAAAVVLDARTGAVLAMGNHTTKGGERLLPEGAANYCVYGGFPAASLAKIIAAAVALEKKGFDNNHLVPVTGRYHTLYPSQVGIERSPYKPELVPLDKAFAMSINPYFGKMWLDSFTDREFLDMSQDLLFNTPLEFDLPVTKSRLVPPADDFQRAEVASGYNTRTTISPLHAALIAALPVNGGRIMRPYIIDSMTDAGGRVIYSHVTKTLSQPLAPRSIALLGQLMEGTVQNGTARNSFSAVRQIGAANGWTLGGKTGSIDLPEHTARCEWFAGFGETNRQSIAVACILVHGAQRTMRSGYVAAEMIRACLDPAGVLKPAPVRTVKPSTKIRTKSLSAAAPAPKNTQKAPMPHAAKATGKKKKPAADNTGG